MLKSKVKALIRKQVIRHKNKCKRKEVPDREFIGLLKIVFSQMNVKKKRTSNNRVINVAMFKTRGGISMEEIFLIIDSGYKAWIYV